MKTTEIKDGSIFHYLNGVPHNEDGPAIMHPNGATSYHIHGKFHRENGPAVEYADGRKSYYLNGIKYDEEKFWIQVQK
jgi:hypothetical protein